MFSDKRVREALEAGQVGLWYWRVDTNALEWSPNLLAIHRRAPETFDGTFHAFAQDIHPDDRVRVVATVEAALAAGGAYEIQYRLPPREGQADVWIEARGRVVSDTGAPRAMLGTCQDVTERKRLELDMSARLAQQQAVAALGSAALAVDSLQDLFDVAVARLAETLSVEFTKILELLPDGNRLLLRAGVGWTAGLVGTGSVNADLSSQAGYTLSASGPVVVADLAAETRFCGSALLRDHGVVSGMSAVIAGSGGKPYGVLGVHSAQPRGFTQYDINFLQSVANILGGAVQNVQAREMQDFVFRELRHRVGNLFSQILSVHEQTARASSDIDELTRKYRDRVLAVAAAHDVVSRDSGMSPFLHTLLEKLLAAYRARIELHGPADLQLPPDMAFALGMVLNELATNAAKYGCFAESGGRLRVEWRAVGGDAGTELALDWIETCVQRIEPPARLSFGTRLVGGLIERQLQGRMSREFRPSGLALRVELPL